MDQAWRIDSHAILVGHGERADEPAYFHPGWLPLFDNSYAAVCFDGVGSFGRDPGGLVFVDFKGGEPRDILVPSLAAWFELMTRLLDEGRIGRTFDDFSDDDGFDRWTESQYELILAITDEMFPGYPIRHTVHDTVALANRRTGRAS